MPLWASGLMSCQLIQGAGPTPQYDPTHSCVIGNSQSTLSLSNSFPIPHLSLQEDKWLLTEVPECSIVMHLILDNPIQSRYCLSPY